MAAAVVGAPKGAARPPEVEEEGAKEPATPKVWGAAADDAVAPNINEGAAPLPAPKLGPLPAPKPCWLVVKPPPAPKVTVDAVPAPKGFTTEGLLTPEKLFTPVGTAAVAPKPAEGVGC